jgi:hypothetical protein
MPFSPRKKNRYSGQGIIVLIGLLFLLAFAPALYAATYYVDATWGHDSAAGANPTADISTGAWKSIAKVNSSSFSPGDSILFKRGETWRETLTVPSSGGAASPITFGAYGSGASPRILGSVQLTNWTSDTGHWVSTYSGTITSVWFVNASDGTVMWGNNKTSKAACVAEYDWYFDGFQLWCYAAKDPNSRYRSVEAATRSACITNNLKDYIIIQNFELAYSNDQGVNSYQQTGWVVDGNTIHHIGIKNEAIAESVSARGTNITIKNNIIHDMGTHGVTVTADNGRTVSGIIIENNIFYDNYHSDIDLQAPNGTFSSAIIRYNLCYNTNTFDYANYSGGGIYAMGTSGHAISGVQIYYNIFYRKTGTSIVIRDLVPSPVIYNNVIYGALPGSSQYAGGIDIFTLGTYDPTNVVVKNNIVVETRNVCFRVDKIADIGSVNNNLWFQSTGGTSVFAQVAGINYHYNDFAAYKIDTGWDTNGKWEDARFVSTSVPDFHLQSSSPAIDAGAEVGLTRDHAGNSVPIGSGPDIGAYEFTLIKSPVGLRILP